MLRKHPASPLLLSVALLITSIFASSTPSPSASPHSPTHQPSVPNPRLYNPNGDYNDDDDDDEGLLSTEVTRKLGGSPPPPCQYDICRDQQESCQKLSLILFCSCPGISGPFDPPDPPSLYSLSLESRGVVVVRWCEPSSTVTRYRVYVEGEDKVHEVRENRRMMELGDLATGTKVCVEAVNNAGVSTQDRKSCARFEPSSSETRLAVKLVLIGAAVVLVIVIVLSLLVWWCKRRQKTPTRTANEGTAGVL